MKLSLAAAYLRNKEPSKAEKLCKEVIKKDRENADAYFLMGEVYLQKNQPEKVQNSFNLASKYKPELIKMIESP